jgi:hypothetical protein
LFRPKLSRTSNWRGVRHGSPSLVDYNAAARVAL